jgi:hypothetical protein
MSGCLAPLQSNLVTLTPLPLLLLLLLLVFYRHARAGEAAVPTERGPISSWSWFSMPHTNCGAGKYCDQFMGNVSKQVMSAMEA